VVGIGQSDVILEIGDFFILKRDFAILFFRVSVKEGT
jgi:hypothetical protein